MPSYDACENCGRDIEAHESGDSDLEMFIGATETLMVCGHCKDTLEEREEQRFLEQQKDL